MLVDAATDRSGFVPYLRIHSVATSKLINKSKFSWMRAAFLGVDALDGDAGHGSVAQDAAEKQRQD